MMRIKINEDVLFQNLEDGAVLLNIETEQYFGLDEIGTLIWNGLNSNKSIEEISQQLLDEYDVESEKLDQDVEKLIDNLVKYQLISLE